MAGSILLTGNVAGEKRKVNVLIRLIASELSREREMRVFVFPRLKAQGKLTDGEAARRLELLDFAIELLDCLQEHGVTDSNQLPIRLTPGVGLNKSCTKVP